MAISAVILGAGVTVIQKKEAVAIIFIHACFDVLKLILNFNEIQYCVPMSAQSFRAVVESAIANSLPNSPTPPSRKIYQTLTQLLDSNNKQSYLGPLFSLLQLARLLVVLWLL